MNDVTSRVEQIAARATALYSRPTVALEIVRLASEPQVDTRAIKECIEQDPALTGKILRVVNSSFFGLRVEVADLGQALTLLGIKPLKLLALGFSLPDDMFAEVAAEQLEWYWMNTLTRAVAARLLCTELWDQDGDEALVAGLMQDIGILALLREFGEPYAKLLAGVMAQRADLAALERDSLGFDHLELSAALMRQWNLPSRLIEAIAAPKQIERLSQLITPEADLARILHLADLLAQLVGQRRINALPELLSVGGEYRDLTKGHLLVLVEKLQPQVDQLASVLAVELPADRNYLAALTAAHEQMSSLTEEFAGALRQHRSEDLAYTELLGEARDLMKAMQLFLESKPSTAALETASAPRSRHDGPHERRKTESVAGLHPAIESRVGVVALLEQLSAALPQCRAKRQELSVLLVEAHRADVLAGDRDYSQLMRLAIQKICGKYSCAGVEIVSVTASQWAAIVPDCERRAAVAVASDVIAQVSSLVERERQPEAHSFSFSAGVATIAAVPKNFDPWRLVESAERCLYAARSCSSNTVKSIEI
jgi:HD-like signal output (HDOD) protein